jgi:hypothetical protein
VVQSTVSRNALLKPILLQVVSSKCASRKKITVTADSHSDGSIINVATLCIDTLTAITLLASWSIELNCYRFAGVTATFASNKPAN